jgi:hypothetical protein
MNIIDQNILISYILGYFIATIFTIFALQQLKQWKSNRRTKEGNVIINIILLVTGCSILLVTLYFYIFLSAKLIAEVL